MVAACGTASAPAAPAAEQPTANQQVAAPTSTVTATATVEPTPTPRSFQILPTAVARAEPTPATRTPAPVSSETRQLVERLSNEGMEYLVAFLEEHSPRESGSDAELAAANFLRDEMAELGFQAELQEVTVQQFSRALPAFTLTTPGTIPEDRLIRAFPLSNSGVGDVAGPLVFVQKAFEEEIPEAGLSGSVALIERGQITFQEKVTRVAEAGAIGAVIFNNVPGGFGGILSETGPIPVIAITQEDGLDLQEVLETGDDVTARVFVDIETQTSQNVIAEGPGTVS